MALNTYSNIKAVKVTALSFQWSQYFCSIERLRPHKHKVEKKGEQRGTNLNQNAIIYMEEKDF